MTTSTMAEQRVEQDAAGQAITERNAQTARLALMCWSGAVRGETAEAMADAVFAPGFRSYGPARSGYGALKQGRPVAPLADGFSESRVEIRRVVARAERTVSYLRFSGMHTGEYQGHRPTYRRMEADGYVVHRFDVDGRIIEEWSVLRWK
jgi:hypothetical protein